MSFCLSFSLTEIFAAATNFSPSTVSGPDKVAYPMLKHLPRFGLDFLLQIFALFWSLHSFPSIWKTYFIIFVDKMEKPLDSPAFFRSTSFTFRVSKRFERIILSHLLPFSFPTRPVCPGWSTPDQIFYISQSISDGFNKPKPGSRAILASIDFFEAFDSVWHITLFQKLILAGLPPCFARWPQSFLSDRRACVVFQNHKSSSLRVCRGVLKRSVVGPVLFCFFINNFPATLPSSVSCSLYAVNSAIWSFFHLVSAAVKATQRNSDLTGALV